MQAVVRQGVDEVHDGTDIQIIPCKSLKGTLQRLVSHKNKQ